MQRVVVDIPDNKLSFFMELLKNLGFVKDTKKLTEEQKEFIDDLKDSLEEVEQHQKGQSELQSASKFLDEL